MAKGVPYRCLVQIEDMLQQVQARRELPRPSVRRLIREEVGLSQGQVGSSLGVDRATVSRWESGRRTPKGDLAVAYVALLTRLAREGASAEVRRD